MQSIPLAEGEVAVEEAELDAHHYYLHMDLEAVHKEVALASACSLIY